MGSSADNNLDRLRAAAREFAEALDPRRTQRLPDDFPKAVMRQVAANIAALDKVETQDERQVLVHAQAKLRDVHRLLQSCRPIPMMRMRRATSSWSGR